MLKVSSFTTLFANAESVDKSIFAVMPPHLLLRHRVASLSDHVIPMMTTIRPPYIYAGELEATMFEPLVMLAKQILFDPDFFTPACVIDAFSEMAKRFGVAAEVFNQAGSKVTLDTLSSILTEFTPMWADLASLPSNKTNANTKLSSKDQIAQGMYQYCLGALQMEDKQLIKWPSDIPGRNIEAIKSTTLEDVTRKLWLIGGMGRGAQLPPKMYMARSYDMSLVEWAIKALIDPQLLPANSKRKIDVPALYEDAYVLAVAYIAYLYYSRDDASYDSVFSMIGTMPQAMTRITKLQSTAKRVAWHYAALASAGQMSDLSIAVNLMESAMAFFEPLMGVKTAIIDDIHTRMNTVKKRVAEFTFAPIAEHTDALFAKYKATVSADVILPSFVQSLLDINDLKLDESKVVQTMGKFGLEENKLTKNVWIKPGSVRNFIEYADSLSQAALGTAESITNLMMYYYSTISEFNANALGLPGDLLRDDIRVVKSSEVVYGSPFSKEFLPLSIVKYEYPIKETPRKANFILSAYRFGVIKLAALREKLRGDKGRFVWPHRVTLPVAASSAARFATLPIPFTYVRDHYYPSISNSEEELRAILKAAITPMSPISSFFEDAVTIIATDNFQKEGVINALAGMCIVYDPETKKDLLPTIPTIYGYPTTAFIEGQDKDRPIIKVDVDGKALHFKMHSHVPIPGDLLPTSFLLDSGVIISVNVLSSVMLDGVAKAKAAHSENFDPKNLVGTALADILVGLHYSDIKDVAPLTPILGWSTALLPYPHIFFEYQHGLNALKDTTSLMAFLHVRLQRVLDSRGPLFVVRARIEEDLYLIEPSDDFPKDDADFEPQDLNIDLRFDRPKSNPVRPANKQPEVTPPVRITPSALSPEEQAEMVRQIATAGKTGEGLDVSKAPVKTAEEKLKVPPVPGAKKDTNSTELTGDSETKKGGKNKSSEPVPTFVVETNLDRAGFDALSPEDQATYLKFRKLDAYPDEPSSESPKHDISKEEFEALTPEEQQAYLKKKGITNFEDITD